MAGGDDGRIEVLLAFVDRVERQLVVGFHVPQAAFVEDVADVLRLRGEDLVDGAERRIGGRELAILVCRFAHLLAELIVADLELGGREARAVEHVRDRFNLALGNREAADRRDHGGDERKGLGHEELLLVGFCLLGFLPKPEHINPSS